MPHRSSLRELGSLDLGCQARLRLAETLPPAEAGTARRLAEQAVALARRGGMRQALVEAMRLWEDLGGRGSEDLGRGDLA